MGNKGNAGGFDGLPPLESCKLLTSQNLYRFFAHKGLRFFPGLIKPLPHESGGCLVRLLGGRTWFAGC